MSADRESIALYAADYTHDFAHSRHVAHLAEQLFDSTQFLHDLKPAHKELLVYAALLHDIGWCVGRQKHHKRAFEIIMSNPPKGLKKDELAIVANVARYHRKALPSLSHGEFSILSPNNRDIVCKLAALLRIADGLDVSHACCVEVKSCEINANEAIIGITCAGDCTAEVEAGIKKSNLFQEVFKLRVKFDFLDMSIGKQAI